MQHEKTTENWPIEKKRPKRRPKIGQRKKATDKTTSKNDTV